MTIFNFFSHAVKEQICLGNTFSHGGVFNLKAMNFLFCETLNSLWFLHILFRVRLNYLRYLCIFLSNVPKDFMILSKVEVQWEIFRDSCTNSLASSSISCLIVARRPFTYLHFAKIQKGL